MSQIIMTSLQPPEHFVYKNATAGSNIYAAVYW